MTTKIFCALAGVALLTPTVAAAAMSAGPTLCLPDVVKPGPQWWKSSAKPAAIQLQFAAGATLGPTGTGFVAEARAVGPQSSTGAQADRVGTIDRELVESVATLRP